MSGLLRRIVHPLYRSLETSVHPLRYLFLEITQRCNLQCRHCGSECTRDARLPEMTPGEWTGFLDTLARDFSRDSLVLVITGGEPFCAPGFFAILEKIRSLGLAWGLVTNGHALTPANVARIVHLGVSSVTVSLDGPAASHNWLRGRDDSFARVVEGLRRLTAASIPFLDVVTCVHPGNLGELDEVRDLLVSLGIRHWRLFPIFPKGRAKDDPKLAMDAAQRMRLLEWIARQREGPALGRISVNFSCEGCLPENLDSRVRDEPYFCRAGVSIGSVLCDGSISACPNISRALVQGNVRTDDFKAVWDRRFGRFRDRTWMRRGICADCKDWNRCRGNSLHLWDECTGQTAFCYRKS